MKPFAVFNNTKDCGDTLDNIENARKSHLQRVDGKGAIRNSDTKRRLRTSMNRNRRQQLKKEMLNEILYID